MLESVSGAAFRLGGVAAFLGSLSCAWAAGIALPGATQDPDQVKSGTYQLEPHHGRIAWSINHMGFSTYVGMVTEPKATLVIDPKNVAATKLRVTVDMSSIGTLYAPMDANLKGPLYFDVARYPTAEFISQHVTRTGKRTADVDGMLTMHGVTRPVVLHIMFNQGAPNPKKKSYDLGFQGKALIKRTDFGINEGLDLVGNEISLDLEGEFLLEP